MNKKSITILIVCLIVSVMSVSLAFFSARIIGNGKNVSVNAKELTINFDNNNEIASGIIEPGWSSANTFSITNKSKTNFTYDIVLKNYKNTTKTNGYLVYKITSTNGYNMTEYKDMPKDGENTYDLVIARGITIEPGSSNKQSYTLEIKYLDSSEDQSIDMGSTVTGSLYIVESTTNENNPYTKGTLGYQIMEDNSNIKTRTDFSKTYTDVNIGTMYKAQEENTDVYYFAGDARNNWVKFGGYYWRIIRTNSDGSIRLLYHGTSPEATDAYVDNYVINISANDSMYVGYMYGTSGSLANNRLNTNSSSIKDKIDTWYASNMTSYTKYLSTTAVYCNDREVGSGTYSATGNEFYYAGYTRLITNKTPSYDCSATEDKFTVDTSTGNGKLTYPIALMTADEVSFAGGVYNTNAETWYYLNNKGTSSINTDIKEWWLMTPTYWYSDKIAITFKVSSYENRKAQLRAQRVFDGLYIRPVISLKKDLIYKSGDGSATSPYTIEEVADPKLTDVIKTNTVNENGYRYEGIDPNNYIQMQKSDGTTEMWRIIGLFPDGENGEDVIRVRKVEYETAAYDTNDTNYWPNSTLYNSLKNIYSLTNYKNTVNYKMYLGTSSSYTTLTADGWYKVERGSTPGYTASKNYSDLVMFIGSVGLMYPSDYGYGVLSSDCARTIKLYFGGYDKTALCHDNNWLYQGSSKIQWLISPGDLDSILAFYVFTSGYTDYASVGDYIVSYPSPYSPVMALKSDVTVSGSGTQSDPYVMTN